MTLIVANLRLELASKAEADAYAAWLRTLHGDAITLRSPRAGRGNGVWFLRGQLRYDPAAPPPPLITVAVVGTGVLLDIPAPPALDGPPADALAAHRQARLRRAGASQTRPDDGADRHALHKRLREQHEEPPAPSIPRTWEDDG